MQGKVKILLLDAQGTTLAERHSKNSVMRGGGELIAKLFAGQGSAITHMGVGTSAAETPNDFSLAALQNEAVGETPALTGSTDVELPAGAFAIAVDGEKRLVTVKVRGTLPNDSAVGTIREAGLLSKSEAGIVLYNRVIFAPLTKGNDHELTLFWEVSFPYGDLQWF
ncbi:MAG: hypothetical protein A4E66_00576 [Syntrophus sp. PtaB.Bin001]|nr:MAG: hypothetical protein A4E66_00576 [Syntrophus sp. PtaB.Bin001]